MTSSAEPPGNISAAASAGERLYAARYVLLAAAAAIAAGSLLWDVPVSFSLIAVLAILLVAAFVPRRRSPPRDPAGVAGVVSVWPDTSMKATLEAVPSAAFVLDASGVVRFANSRAVALFPATRPGDPFSLTFRSPEIGAAFGEALSGRASVAEYHEPGSSITLFQVSFGPLKLSGNQLGFIFVGFDDVSDRRAVARMRADFVANASHELRTPLASLTGFIETLLGPARNDPQSSEKFLKIMLDQARRMRRLIDDLLSLSKAEMRVNQRPTERVGLNGLLGQVADTLAPLARESSVELAVQAPADTVEIVGDRDELIQVFQNLVENAIRYGGSGGRVDIVLEPQPGAHSVRVHVQDYGPGIPPEHLPRLTERFYRIDAGASREKKGTGLGLAIVKHILTRHQTRLEVKSRAGEGTRFSVEFPLAAADGAAGGKILPRQ